MAGALEIIQVVAEMALLGQQIINVFEAVSPSAVSDEDLVIDLSDQLEVGYSEVIGRMVDNLTFVSLLFRNLTDNTIIGEFDWPTLTAGENLTDILPLGVAGLATFPTAQPKVRGRKFIGGIAEANMGDGVWDSAMVTALEGFADAIVEPFAGSESTELWSFGVVDKGGTFRPFISAQTSNIPAYQRRRKQGVGG